MKSKSFGPALRVLISLSVVGLILFFLRDKISHAIEIIRTEVDWTIYTFAIMIYILALTLLALRLQMIWKVQKINFSWPKVFQISIIGLFFNFFLPSAVGGDVIKIYYANKQARNKINCSTSVLVDRLMGFIAIIIIAGLSLIFYAHEVKSPAVFVCIYLFTGILVFCILFFASPKFASMIKLFKWVVPSAKIRGSLQTIYRSIHEYVKYPSLLASTVLLSVFIQIILILFFALLSKSLGNDLPFSIFFFVVPVTTIVSMAPSLGGLGVREAGSLFLYSQYMSQERALALTILADMVVYGFGLIGGIVFASYGTKKSDILQNMES